MGWLYMESLDGHSCPKAYLDAQFTYQREQMSAQVLRSAIVGGTTYYAAVELLRPDKPREAIGLVCLIDFNPHASDGMIFGYKDMDEAMGPVNSDCPTAILDLLTPTQAPYALAWRARCSVNAARRHDP